jgi:hypothetical protein
MLSIQTDRKLILSRLGIQNVNLGLVMTGPKLLGYVSIFRGTLTLSGGIRTKF